MSEIIDGNLARYVFREARNFQNKKATHHGAIIQTIELVAKDGTLKPMHVANPFAVLYTAVSECTPFATFMYQRLKEFPCSPERPWNVVMYSDEVTPGNPLATLNERKFQAVYWSFLEFGPSALSREEAWFIVATSYSTHVVAFAAGLSQAFSGIMKLFWPDEG